MLILIEGIVMCFILLIFCVIGIANGPEKFTVFYEKNVQTLVCHYRSNDDCRYSAKNTHR